MNLNLLGSKMASPRRRVDDVDAAIETSPAASRRYLSNAGDDDKKTRYRGAYFDGARASGTTATWWKLLVQ